MYHNHNNRPSLSPHIHIGPGSSDTSEPRVSQDEVSRQGEEDLGSDSDGDYEDARSITPNPRDVGVVRAEPVKLRNGISSLADSSKAFHRDQVSDIQPPPVTVMHMSSKDSRCSASDDNLRHDSNETSDTDLTPLPRTHLQHWTNKKFESDLSTAPFSSETSDMETSGNERVFTTDGGSATDLNPKPPRDSPPTPSSSPSPMGKVPTRQPPSCSSGDEIKKNRISVKSKPIQKPSPPPKKPEPPTAVKPSGIVKKPLHATKSSPLGNKVSGNHSSPLKSQQSETGFSPSRSKSIKVNIPAKPKPPPVPAKPASKPEVRPKPARSTSIQPTVSGGSPRAKLEGKPRANSVEEHGTAMRKIHSETDLKVVIRRSPTMVARKLTQVKEEAERRQSTPPRPNPPPAPLKPTIPVKPKRQPSERKGKPAEQGSPPVEQGTASKESQPSDSSKTPSSSELTTSGPSQSPTASPYTSPSLSKRFSTSGPKPAILPKKHSVKSHHRANSDSARLLRKIETTDIGSSLSAVSVSSVIGASATTEQLPGEMRNDESKQSMRTSNMSPEMQAPPTDGTTSPPPPPIPPRSKVGRKSSHLELVIPVSDSGLVRSSPTPDSAYRKKLSAPRRPPPSPPSPLPKRTTEAQPTSNELIDSNSQISHSDSRNQSQRPVSMHGREVQSTHIDDAQVPIHQYAKVNKHQRAFKISPEKPRSKTPDFLSRDQTSLRSTDSDHRKNSDSELEVHSTKKRTKVIRRESSRRAPPKPPKYDTPDETTGYVPVNTDTMSSQQKLGSQSPRSRSSVSPLRDEGTPPPLPTQPIPKKKSSLQKSASTVSERPRVRDPVYEVIPDLPKRTYKRAKHREYEEIDLIDGDLPAGLVKPAREAPVEPVRPVSEAPVEPVKSPVELVRTVRDALPHRQTQKQPRGDYAQLPIEDLRENWKTSPQLRRRPAKSFSGKKSQSLMYRRFSSERLNQRSKLLTIDTSMNRRKVRQNVIIGRRSIGKE